MPAVRRNWIIKTYWRTHKWLYQKSGGRIGANVFGTPVLLLFTIGRKTSKKRANLLMYIPKGDAYVVAASNAGAPQHPAWWLNLQANPNAQIQVGSKVIPAIARESEGKERERLWEEFVLADGGYQVYEDRTTRRIPVVVLEPERQAEKKNLQG